LTPDGPLRKSYDQYEGRRLRRIEVITGVGRRRRWTAEEKARIVAESLDPATTVSAVARRYGLHASQLFVWRQRFAGPAARDAPEFVPVVVNEGAATSAGWRAGSRSRSARLWCGSARTWTRGAAPVLEVVRDLA
jgi:transposase